jgi:hypothetical protein
LISVKSGKEKGPGLGLTFLSKKAYLHVSILLTKRAEREIFKILNVMKQMAFVAVADLSRACAQIFLEGIAMDMKPVSTTGAGN